MKYNNSQELLEAVKQNTQGFALLDSQVNKLYSKESTSQFYFGEKDNDNFEDHFSETPSHDDWGFDDSGSR